MKIDQNDPAFPTCDVAAHHGLTKREWMAAMICAGMQSSRDGFSEEEDDKQCAYLATKQADALIAELNKQQP